MFEYIKWRGDLSFEASKLNEVDSMIFSMLCYEDFDDILNKDIKLTIEEVAKIFFKKYTIEELKNRKTLTYKTYELLDVMSKSVRYKDLVLSHYVNEINSDKDFQFSALTYEYKSQWKYIAFRGTDDTIAGWKEDFTMAYKDEVPSQIKAVDYIHSIFDDQSKLKKLIHPCPLYIGGHSKGGNLAIYASCKAPEEIQKRIVEIHNFDGPGFQNHFWEQQDTKLILNKITTFIPTSSFFGRMFTHQGKIKVFNSKYRGLLQHDPFNWTIEVTKLQYTDKTSEGSDKASQKFNELMENIGKEEREEVIESLFRIFKTLDVETFEDFTKIDAKSVLQSLIELYYLSNESKKLLKDFLTMIWDVADI